MRTNIDPKVDYAFKAVFGKESNSDLLIALLNAFLPWTIVSVTIPNPFTEKTKLDDKLGILDVLARDERGRQYNVEIQLVVLAGLERRLMFYWAKVHVAQVKKGDDLHQLNPTIAVWFLNGNLLQSKRWHHRFVLRDADDPQVTFTDQIEVHIIELPKFKKAAEAVRGDAERWAIFLRDGGRLDPDKLPPTLQTPAIKKALQELAIMSQTTEERERYRLREKFLIDQAISKEEHEKVTNERDELAESLRQAIKDLETALGLPKSSDLAKCDRLELQRRQKFLQQQVRKQHGKGRRTDPG